MTTKVLKVTTSFIQGKDIKLKAVGIRVLYKLWTRQRRCWKSLRSILSDWVENRKLNNSQVIENTKSEIFEVEIAALTTIR
jgi:hypothetical protein